MKKIILLLVLIALVMPAKAQRPTREKYRTRPDARKELKEFKKEKRQDNWERNNEIRKKKRENPKRPLFYFSPETTVFYNLNMGDVASENNTKAMQSKNNFAFAFALGWRLERKYPYGAFLAAHFGWKVVPQNLTTRIDDYTLVQKFDNNFLNFKLIGGLKIPLMDQRGIDIGIGFQNAVSISNRRAEDKLHYVAYNDTKTGETLSRLRTVQITNWGDYNADLPAFFCPTLQIGLTDKKIWKGKMLRIALEISTKINNNDDLNNNNHSILHEMDDDRNITSTETFNDRHTAIGLNFSLGI